MCAFLRRVCPPPPKFYGNEKATISGVQIRIYGVFRFNCGVFRFNYGVFRCSYGVFRSNYGVFRSNYLAAGHLTAVKCT